MSKGQGAACESRVMFILDQSEKSVVCPWFRPPLTPPNSGGEASGRISPPEPGGVRGGMNQQRSEAPIIINSGYRSAAVNKAVGGVKGSNHLTGCAADIRVAGIEQLVRYATILLDISDESQEDFDELLLERSPRGGYWLHFAVRPSGNRRKVLDMASQ